MLTLRCDEPAPGWEGHVLPIGNGALGACVFGALATERVQLDEKPLRTGGPGSAEPGGSGNWPTDRPGAPGGVRRVIDERGSMAPEEVAARWPRSWETRPTARGISPPTRRTPSSAG
ncbi:glycoside hydrolase N-terminal domain-containing protein [Nonomuraea sp. NPDC001023]|uniref:glycoside hydrolase N-terminal domain-containing protein n=1 Tax=unclassified Nonomuraea TaxID=2593643 RepID=UPI0033325EA8